MVSKLRSDKRMLWISSFAFRKGSFFCVEEFVTTLLSPTGQKNYQNSQDIDRYKI